MKTRIALLFLPSILLYLWPMQWSYGKSYAISLPFIVICIYTIAVLKKQSPIVWEVCGIAFLIPAVGYVSSRNALTMLDMRYLIPYMGAQHTINFIQFYCRGIAPLVLAAAVGALLLPRKRMGVFLLAIGAFSLLNHGLSYLASVSLLRKEWTMGAYYLNASTLLYFFPPLVSLLFARYQERRTRYLYILVGVMGSYLLGPPAFLFLQNVPVGRSHPQGPIGEASLGFSLPGANPESQQFAQQLNAQKTRRIYKPNWWCTKKPTENWKTQTRLSVGIAAKADLLMKEINFYEIFRRGATRLSLIGRAETVPTGILSDHISYPAQHLWLDPSPEHIRYAQMKQNDFRWLVEKAEIQACGIWVDGETTIGALFTEAERLRKEDCQEGIFLLLGDPGNVPNTWRPPFPCSPQEIE